MLQLADGATVDVTHPGPGDPEGAGDEGVALAILVDPQDDIAGPRLQVGELLLELASALGPGQDRIRRQPWIGRLGDKDAASSRVGFDVILHAPADALRRERRESTDLGPVAPQHRGQFEEAFVLQFVIVDGG